MMRCCGKLLFESRQRRSGAGLEIRTGNTRHKSRRLQDDAESFPQSSLSLFLFLFLLSAFLSLHFYFYWSHVFSHPSFPSGRLKVIALASAVGVSAGLITLTVAIMIR